MGGIFISYRRQDTGGHAGRLRDHLRQRFGARVFQDVDNIADGEEFEQVLARALETCEVALVVIGRSWLHCTDDAGRRRLDDAHDWVRIEIQQLLQRQIRVIPVLVGGATMPAAEALPDDLRSLAKRQARELRDTAWDADVRALIERLEQLLQAAPAAIVPTPPPTGAAPRHKALAIGAAALMVVLGGLWAVGWQRGDGSAATTPDAGAAGAASSAAAGSAVTTGAADNTGTANAADAVGLAVRALGLVDTVWQIDDFSGMERDAGAPTRYVFRQRAQGTYLEPTEGPADKHLWRVQQLRERALTLLPQPAGGRAFEFMYVFTLSPDGQQLGGCQTVRAADFSALGPCQWRYRRVPAGGMAAMPAATPVVCGLGSLPDAVDPACVAAARAVGLLGDWRARGNGADLRFAVAGDAVRLTGPALKAKGDGDWMLALRSVNDGRITLSWTGAGKASRQFDPQSWIEYELSDGGARLVKCREIMQLSTRQEATECTDTPPFLVRAVAR